MLAVSKQLLLPPLVVHVDWAKNVFVVGIRIRRPDTCGEATNEFDTRIRLVFHAESTSMISSVFLIGTHVLNTSCLYVPAWQLL